MKQSFKHENYPTHIQIMLFNWISIKKIARKHLQLMLRFSHGAIFIIKLICFQFCLSYFSKITLDHATSAC